MRWLAIGLIIIGVVILFFGISSSQTIVERFTKDIFGRYSENTMMYIIVGISMIVVGGVLAIIGYKNAKP